MFATRFGSLSPRAAGAVLAALLLAIALGLWTGVAPPHSDVPVSAANGGGDVGLYQRIVEHVAAGQSYYAAAVAEHRRWNYPLRPVFTVRSPLLATGLAMLPSPATRMLSLWILVAGVLVVWGRRLYALSGRVMIAGAGLAILACGLVSAFSSQSYLFHSIWAGSLIALSLGLYDPRRWWWSVAVGLVAALMRDLASPYLLAMAAAALWEGRRREALAWAAAIAIFLVFMAVHADLVAARLLPGDKVSASWLAFGGWPFLLLTAKWNALLLGAPPWWVVLIVPLMIAGIAAWPGSLGLRLALVCLGYCGAFLLVGRPDNFLWGVIPAPLLSLGLLTAPAALRDIFSAMRPGIARSSTTRT